MLQPDNNSKFSIFRKKCKNRNDTDPIMALELRDSFSSMQPAIKTPSVPHFQCRRMSMKYFDQTDGDTGRPYRVFRVVMIGDCGAGKTSFIKRIVTGEFDYDSASTIGMDYHLINITMEEFDFDIHIQLWVNIMIRNKSGNLFWKTLIFWCENFN